MKKSIIYIANFTLCLFIFSCNKIEIPEPEPDVQTTPILDMQLKVGDDELNLAAGVDCFKMDTDYNLDHLGIYSFWGKYQKDENCEQEMNEQSFKVEIRDNQFRFDLEDISFDGVRIGAYDFFNGHEVLGGKDLFLTYYSKSNFDQIITSTGDVLEVDAYGELRTTLTSDVEWILIEEYDFNEQLLASRKYYLFENYEQSFFPKIHMEIDSLEGNILLAAFHIQGDPQMYTYEWDDGSTDAFMQIPFDDLTLDCIHTKCLKIFKNEQLLVEDCISFEVDAFDIHFHSIFSFLESFDFITETEAFETVIIEYTDENGKIYSSEGDNLMSSFEVISKEPFIDNPDGLESSKLQVEIDCILYSMDGQETIHLENTSGTIAVSYPK